ncbi:MAG TPA: V-type ATPase subunit, partial [Trueperaceae bacterium]|nr:V-type ATPase subunit [Trueperaceae bacterium]
LNSAEAAVREVLDHSAKRLAADPLDIGVVVDFLRRKEAEAAMIRLLARGKFYGVPRATLEKELADA